MKLSRLVPTAFLLTGCSVYNGMKNMEKSTHEMNGTTREMYETTREMKASTDSLFDKTAEMSADTQAMRKATEDMVAKTTIMTETTQDMADATNSMRESTENLKNTSTELHRQTEDLYEDSRQGLSLDLRLNILHKMDAAKKQFAKIKYANFYFKSLEYQLWKQSGRDNQSKLDHLRMEAVQEVIQSIDELAPKGRRSLSPLSNQNAMQNLYALSAALHVMNNDKRLPEIARSGDAEESDNRLDHSSQDHTPTGVLALFYSSLEAKKSVEDGLIPESALAPYQASVLKFEEIVTYILKLRFNFLTAVAIKQLATLDGEELHLLRRVSMWLRPWTARTDERNSVQLNYMGWVLDEAQVTRNRLIALGIDVPLDGMLKRVATHARFKWDEKDALPKAKAIRGLSEKINQIVSEDVPTLGASS